MSVTAAQGQKKYKLQNSMLTKKVMNWCAYRLLPLPPSGQKKNSHCKFKQNIYLSFDLIKLRAKLKKIENCSIELELCAGRYLN